MMRRLCLLWVILLIGTLALAPASQASAQAPQPDFIPGSPLIIRADAAPSTLFVAPPAASAAPRLNAVGGIVVDFITGGANNCQPFPADAQTAFRYAADIWAGLLDIKVPIHISACWAALPSGVLGSSGPTVMVKAQPGVTLPVSGAYYPIALANALNGTDLNGASSEITAEFNSAFGAWYFGTAGSPGPNYDFVSVVLHEIAHGLGFSGCLSPSGLASCGGFPAIYDHFTTDAGGVALLNYANNIPALTSALTSAAFFSGPDAKTANGGQPVPLYAPAGWLQGSSYSHLASVYDLTSSALMTYSLSNGEAVHSPGPVTMGILSDEGWTTFFPPPPPSNLTAAWMSTSEIDLTWKDNSFSETGFQVERSTDGGPYALLVTAPKNATTYADKTAQPSSAYSYRIRAINAVAGSTTTLYASIYSNIAATIPAGPPPAPTNLTAIAMGQDTVLVTWQDNSSNESGFKLERTSDNGANWTAVITTAPNVTSYLDNGLQKGKTYDYRITALSGLGNSPVITSANVTTWLTTYYLRLPFFIPLVYLLNRVWGWDGTLFRPIPKFFLPALGRGRGWGDLRLLSAATGRVDL